MTELIELSDLMDPDAEAATAVSPEAVLADALVNPPQAFKRRDDPSIPHYPRGLILDLALRTAPVAELLEAYRISTDQFKQLVNHPVFRQELRDMSDKIKEEGFSFRVKAQAQAEAYLQQAWQMVHDAETPANVRADLIKWTTKVASLEPKPNDPQPGVAVNIDMRGMSDDDLKARVMSIVMKRAENAKSSLNANTYDAG